MQILTRPDERFGIPPSYTYAMHHPSPVPAGINELRAYISDVIPESDSDLSPQAVIQNY